MSTLLAPLLQAYFANRLLEQMRASPQTIQTYAYAWRLLLGFAQARLRKAPSAVLLTDLDASFIGDFLTHLEKVRGNSPRTRNARLAAFRSFFRYVAPREPAHADLIRCVLDIPQKRCERNIVAFLTPEEGAALLDAPDRGTWIGRRDHALLALAIETGLRVSELVNLRIEQLVLGRGAHVTCHGKGRKERVTPVSAATAKLLKTWIRERGNDPRAHVFPSRRGGPLTRDAVERCVHRHATRAEHTCPSLAEKAVSPHVLRHTTAVTLLRAGVDRAVIALWLGHESIETTQMYLDADLSIKEAALQKTAPRRTRSGRFRPSDSLLTFLTSL